jgi:putative YhdH/YhfP family quinone oxidoreductase
LAEKIKSMDTFQALWTTESSDGGFTTSIQSLPFEILGNQEVLIRVSYSSLNYKDALSASGHRGITRDFPHIPGIDAAGVVVSDQRGIFHPGDEVIVTGFDQGMNSHGGLSEYISVPGDWVIAMPTGLTVRSAMQLGTAGLTAGLAIQALLANGLSPNAGEILVTGATGGVGMIAVALLAKLQFNVVAMSGKPELDEKLMELGAKRIIRRQEFLAEKPRALYPMQFAGAIDVLGGEVLVKLLKSLQYDGVVAACGMAAGVDLPLQVYPFILRGARLIGIYSADAPLIRKQEIWQLLASDWAIPGEDLSTEISLEKAPKILDDLLANRSSGRYVVKI